ncbi:MAG: methyltransferase [Thermonemataceae bacterium]|nr:methyltransferase [Thermonemataceae bacterium]
MRQKNTYFQFKKFRIEQKNTSMKVSTEACILGAYAKQEPNPKYILDIGTGTGLLSLMLAQRYPQSFISAVEIEESAYQEAVFNFQSSPFHHQIKGYHLAMQKFSSSQQFDLIISNPPFYQNSLLANSSNRNIALHQQTLNFEDLVNIVHTFLNENGSFWLILPTYEMKLFTEMAQKQNLHICQNLKIFNQIDKPVFREIRCFQKKEKKEIQDKLIIRNRDNIYTDSFQKLLQDFYLAF